MPEIYDPKRCVVGVDLVREIVTVVARDPDSVRDAYRIDGEHAADGLIYLDTWDQTYNGRRAREIALAETAANTIGLGWRFAVRLSDEGSK